MNNATNKGFQYPGFDNLNECLQPVEEVEGLKIYGVRQLVFGETCNVLDRIALGVLGSPGSIFDINQEFKLPIDIYCRHNSEGSQVEDRYVRLEWMGVDGERLILAGGNKVSLTDFDKMCEENIIGSQTLGMIYFIFLCLRSKDPKYKYRLIKGFREFGIFKDDSVNALDPGIILMSYVQELPKMYRHFHKNCGSVPNREFLNPFEDVSVVSNEGNGYCYGLAAIQNGYHFGQDALVYATDGSFEWGGVMDGVSSTPGSLGFVELLSRRFALDDRFDFGRIKSEMLEEFRDAQSTFAKYEIDKFEKKIKLSAIGDSWAIHFDKSGKVKQIVGGETWNYKFMNCNGSSPTGGELDLFVLHSNCPSGVLDDDGVWGAEYPLSEVESKSEAPYEDGDFVLVASDFVDKIFLRLCKHVLGLNVDVHNDEFWEFDDSLRGDSAGVVSNRNQKGWVHGRFIVPMLRYMASQFAGKDDKYEELKKCLLSFFANALDDGSFILKKV